ncbi:MAG: [citrate (pro-3S)-lyase] ligase [Salinivirgaceae bacterium]|nr:[citrate (pro-3S)-lyase] ligase [Salinivirgaceae bacterium]
MLIENTDYREEIIDLDNCFDIKLVSEFLTALDFSFHPESVDYTMVLYNLKGDIIGTGSSQQNVLKYVAVAPKYRETSAVSKIVSHLTERIVPKYHTVFVYTRPENVIVFKGLGFKHIASAKPLFSLLEYGTKTITTYQKVLAKYKQATKTNDIATIVVNCNPFTNGHKYLIEKAAAENECLYLFVVQEDFAVFPFQSRWNMIQEGIAHLSNVTMIPGGDYVVSGKTFPYYFLKSIRETQRIIKQGELDIDIFRQYIIPILGIKKRYVGTETYCQTTAAYNQAMKKLLPEKGIELIELERVTCCVDEGEQFISASKIRDAIKNNELDKFMNHIPEVTRKFLLSPEAEEIIKKIKISDARH